MTDSALNRGRFVPLSAKDFSVRARRLALLLNQPLQKTQEQLARLYGFAGAHQLRREIERLGDALLSCGAAGPYDENFDDGGRLRALGVRRQFDQLPFESEDAALRRSLVSEMGLFASPEMHDERYADVVAALNAATEGVGIGRYAVLGRSSTGEAIPMFTGLGQLIRDRISEAWQASDFLARNATLLELARDHPDNPWALAAKLDADMEAYRGLIGWPVVTPAFYRRAKQIVSMTRRLYGDLEHLAIADPLIVASRFGSDADFYARELDRAGRLALAVGDHAEARKCFRRILKMERLPVASGLVQNRWVGRFGTEGLLHLACVNDGRPAPRAAKAVGSYGAEEANAWKVMRQLSNAVLSDEPGEVRQALGPALMALGRIETRDGLEEALAANPDRPCIDYVEVGHASLWCYWQATAPLWRANPRYAEAIISVTRDRRVALAHSEFNRAAYVQETHGTAGARLAQSSTRLLAAIERAWDHA